MWCDQVLRNIPEPTVEAFGPRAVDYVELEWHQLGRVLKTRSRAGEEIRIVLPAGQKLRHGDLLFEDESRAIVLRVNRSRVIVALPHTCSQAALLTLELGNLHCPTQIDESTITFPEKPATLQLVNRLEIPFQCETQQFSPIEISAIPPARVSENFALIRGGESARSKAVETTGSHPGSDDSFQASPRNSAKSA